MKRTYVVPAIGVMAVLLVLVLAVARHQAPLKKPLDVARSSEPASKEVAAETSTAKTGPVPFDTQPILPGDSLGKFISVPSALDVALEFMLPVLVEGREVSPQQAEDLYYDSIRHNRRHPEIVVLVWPGDRLEYYRTEGVSIRIKYRRAKCDAPGASERSMLCQF